jgi:hypothetical protein
MRTIILIAALTMGAVGFGGTAAKSASFAHPVGSGELAKRGIILVSGKKTFGSERMLNPQPLPPKSRVAGIKVR